MANRKTNKYAAAADRAKAPERTVQPAEKVRTEPIRVTLDLAPKQHAKFRRWCNLAAAETGLPAVQMAPVLRLLIERLDQDPELSAEIREGLQRLELETQDARSRRH
ncbi:hypothetical protein [Kitasatospora sp. MBT66]|uniref:hypothetical protein n=1 Tax=Kitasatospora sp. MBT66 TaxID=1444769 RepID=UPI0005BDC28C|nr:hypothetical protein [Kitasatospora sp. MBT66]